MKHMAVLGALALGAVTVPQAGHTQGATPESEGSYEVPSPSEAMVEAEVNKARMANRPSVLSGPRAEFPEAEKLAGHHGTAMVSGIVDTQGNFTELKLRQSTGAPVLDQSALDAAMATRFNPATDADDQALSVPVTMPFEFYSWKSTEPGGGLIRYRCDQFIRDIDWWQSIQSDPSGKGFELQSFMVGFAVLAVATTGRSDEMIPTGRMVIDQWPHWIEACRTHPDELFVDQTGPFGHAAAGLANPNSRKRK